MDNGNLFLAATIFPANQNGSYSIPYRPSDVYAALKEAIGTIDGFKLNSFNDLGFSIDINVGMSWRSMGEAIQISVLSSPSGDSILNINSKSKMGLYDWGKNKTNANNILSALQKQLQSSSYAPVQTSPQTLDDPADRLLKLKSLLDNHVITEEEFEAKKEELLQLL